jgi:hypothetical protein
MPWKADPWSPSLSLPHPPRPPAQTNRAGEFVGEKINSGGQLFAPAQIMEVLRLGQLLPEFAQPLLVGFCQISGQHSCLKEGLLAQLSLTSERTSLCGLASGQEEAPVARPRAPSHCVAHAPGRNDVPLHSSATRVPPTETSMFLAPSPRRLRSRHCVLHSRQGLLRFSY